MFFRLLKTAQRQRGSRLCIGLDPVLEALPASVRGAKRPLFAFNQAIIDATAPFACAYKLQFANYGASRAEGDLEDTIAYIHDRHPGLPVILDAKRCDVDHTAALYAREAFERYKADALTVVAYAGGDALQPFLERRDKGIYIVCKTSNLGGSELQDLLIADRAPSADGSGVPLFLRIAERTATKWNSNGNVGLVVGGTFPRAIARIRQLAPELPLLIPGFGLQQAALADCLEPCGDSVGGPMIFSASRSIIGTSTGEDFAEAAAAKAREMRDDEVAMASKTARTSQTS